MAGIEHEEAKLAEEIVARWDAHFAYCTQNGMTPESDDGEYRLARAYLDLSSRTGQGEWRPIPDKWPDSNPPAEHFMHNLNVWFHDAATFVSLVQSHPSAWLSYNASKYLNIRIDTRSGDFVLTGRNDEKIDMDRLLKTWREDKFRGAYGEPLPPPPSSQESA